MFIETMIDDLDNILYSNKSFLKRFRRLIDIDYFESYYENYKSICDSENILNSSELTEDDIIDIISKCTRYRKKIVCDDIVFLRRYNMNSKLTTFSNFMEAINAFIKYQLTVIEETILNKSSNEEAIKDWNESNIKIRFQELIETHNNNIINPNDNVAFLNELFFDIREDNKLGYYNEDEIDAFADLIINKDKIISEQLIKFEDNIRNSIISFKPYEHYLLTQDKNMIAHIFILIQYFKYLLMDIVMIGIDIYHNLGRYYIDRIKEEINGIKPDNNTEINWNSNEHPDDQVIPSKNYMFLSNLSMESLNFDIGEEKINTKLRLKLNSFNVLKDKMDKKIAFSINVMKKKRYPFYKLHFSKLQTLYNTEGDKTRMYELELLGDPTTIVKVKCIEYLKDLISNYGEFKQDIVSLIKDINDSNNTKEFIKTANTYITKWDAPKDRILKETDSKRILEHIADALYYRFGKIILNFDKHKIHHHTVESMYQNKKLPKPFTNVMSLLTEDPYGKRVEKTVKEIFQDGYQSLILFSAMDADKIRTYSESLYKLLDGKISTKELYKLYNENQGFLKKIRSENGDKVKLKFDIKRYNTIDKIIRHMIRFHGHISMVPNNILYMARRVDNLAHEACVMLLHSTRGVDDNTGQKTLVGRVKRVASNFRKSEIGNSII